MTFTGYHFWICWERRLFEAEPRSYRRLDRLQIFRSKHTDTPNQSGFRDGHEILGIEYACF